MLAVGPEAVVDMAKQLGVSAELPPVNSLVLGTGEVSVLDMATAFSTFANRGVRNDPTFVAKIEQVDDDGTGVEVLEQHTPTGQRVLTEEEADLVTYCLEDVVNAGTGKAAKLSKPVAGKTGTTQENRDAWFVGYTPRLTAAVWMGYPGAPGEEPRFMADVHGRAVTGGSFPAEIWAKFMRAATRDMDTGDFVTPTDFPGRVLNPELELPTSTTVPKSSSTTSATSTTAPSGSTTTAAPAVTTTAPPSPTTTAPPTTTTATTAPSQPPPLN
jgi:penicillin-binding protein 1A